MLFVSTWDNFDTRFQKWLLIYLVVRCQWFYYSFTELFSRIFLVSWSKDRFIDLSKNDYRDSNAAVGNGAFGFVIALAIFAFVVGALGIITCLCSRKKCCLCLVWIILYCLKRIYSTLVAPHLVFSYSSLLVLYSSFLELLHREFLMISVQVKMMITEL